MNRTVFGVPLEDGERVVYFHRSEPGWQKPVLIAVGILLAFAIIGLFFLAAGLTATTTVYAVTTRRFLVITRKKTEEMRFVDVVSMGKYIKQGQLRRYELSRAKGQGFMWLSPSAAPGLLPLLERFARDRNAFDAMPEVAFDADTAVKPAKATARRGA